MKRISIIVPYRDRYEHFTKFVPHMHEFFKTNHSDIDYTINVIEQANLKQFNRGKLINVGFDLTKNKNDYFCFHDIDMLPLDKNCDYSYVQFPTHMATAAKQFNYRLPYNEYFGGVTMFNNSDFIKVNGFYNDYWGWGAEDDDLYKRCLLHGLQIQRRNGRYDSLAHKSNEFDETGKTNPDTLNNRKTFFSRNENLKEFCDQGLTTLKYDLIKKISYDEKVTVYKVNI